LLDLLGDNPASEITSALKMETARFSETLVYTNQSTRRFKPKEHHQGDQLVARSVPAQGSTTKKDVDEHP
jgi:hypothetical protein